MRIPGGLLDGHGLLHRRDHGGEVLLVGDLGQAHLHGRGRLVLLAFLRSVLDHQEELLAERHDKRVSGRLEIVQRFAVIHALQLKTELLDGLVIAIEHAIQPESARHFFKQLLGIAAQIEIPGFRGAVQFRRWQRLARLGQFPRAGFVELPFREGRGFHIESGLRRRHGFRFERGARLYRLAAQPVVAVLGFHDGGLGIQQVCLGHVAAPLGFAALLIEVPGGDLLRHQAPGRDRAQ